MLLSEILLKNFKMKEKDVLVDKTLVTKEFKPLLDSFEERKRKGCK